LLIEMNSIYLDNAATTPVRKEVFEEMLPYFCESYGNPSSIYEIAKKNKRAVEAARGKIAAAIGASPEEIFFTGSGTEADNWAIKGIAEQNADKGRHIVTTAIEHHAVLHTCEYLQKLGWEISYVPVDEYGLVNAEDVKNAVRGDTSLITVMFANNEIGTLQPIAEIGAFASEKGIAFHTDAIQAFGHVPIDVKSMNIGLMSLSAHKTYGPKGVGALYVRKGIRLPSFIHGGGQERGHRAGTENVPGIVGFGKAAELAIAEMGSEAERLTALRDRMIDGILGSIPYCRLNGSRDKRLPGNVNISFEFIEGESILLFLDMNGISASSGSACTSGSLDPSHVLLAIGLPHEKAHGSVRMTFGRETTEGDVDFVIKTLAPIIQRLRDMSPLYEKFIKGLQEL
jgi:cysteine desulfurase